MFEALESRRLFSVTLVNRVVQVTGTDQRDDVVWFNVNGQLKVEVNSVAAPLINAADFDSIVIDVGGGNDRVRAVNNTFPATILGGSGNDVLTGGFGNDVIVGGKGNDFLTGESGDDTIVGSRGDDTLYGNGGADHLFGSAGTDTAWSEGSVDTIDAEKTVPMDTWAPLDESKYGNVLDGLRVKNVNGRGYVAVLDFYYGSSGFRESITSVVREGNTFRITASVDRWEGGSLAVMTRRLKTATLSHDLPKGSFQVIVQTPGGTIVERQRFGAT